MGGDDVEYAWNCKMGGQVSWGSCWIVGRSLRVTRTDAAIDVSHRVSRRLQLADLGRAAERLLLAEWDRGEADQHPELDLPAYRIDRGSIRYRNDRDRQRRGLHGRTGRSQGRPTAGHIRLHGRRQRIP